MSRCPRCELVMFKARLVASGGLILAFIVLMCLIDEVRDTWLWSFLILGALQLFCLFWLWEPWASHS